MKDHAHHGTDDTLDGLFEDLVAAPERFEALTALRLAALWAERRGADLTIRTDPSTALAPVPVTGVVDTGHDVSVATPLTGLTGPLSPLPPAYTEIAARDRRRRAGGLSAFLDLFGDRMARLFAAAASKYNLPALLQWAEPSENRILVALRGLIGAATPGLPERLPLPGDETLRHAGLLGQRTRSALGLRALASAELGLPVTVQQFRRRWRPLPLAEQTALNGSRALGRDTSAGAQVCDRAGQVRLVVGPVRYADFLSLELGRPRVTRLARLVRLYLGPSLDFDIQVILDRRDIPQTQMGGPLPARLGWNTWAIGEPAGADADQAVIDGRQAEAAEAA